MSCGKKGGALTFTPPATHVQDRYGRVVVGYVNGAGRQADMPDGVSHMIHSRGLASGEMRAD